jgi:hypothetical protein
MKPRLTPTGITSVEEPTEVGTFTITLKRGQTIRNPASTKGPIWGPAVIEWTNHRDHGITVRFISIGP